MQNLANRLVRPFSACWRRLAILCAGLLLAGAAAAEIIDRIDVKPAGEEAEIVIRFTTPVQYQRHAPPIRGTDVSIYFLLQAYDGTEELLTREVHRVAKNGLIDGVTVTYPESNGAMSVHFPELTRYRVRQGNDGRSISLFVPAKVPPATPAAPSAADAAAAVTATAAPAAVAAVAAVAAQPAATAPAPSPQPRVVAEPRPVPGIADVVVPAPTPAPTATAAPAAAASTASPAPTAAPVASTPAAPVSAPVPAPVAPAPAVATVTAEAAPPASSTTTAPPASAAAAGEAPAAPVPTSAEVQAQGQRLLDQARTAYNVNDLALAVATLNTALNLPTNPSSAGAQELIGQVRERNGELDKAKAEYELYLKLYPQAEGVARVKDRLAKLATAAAALAAAPAAAEAPTRPVRRQDDTGWKISGGLSQYRYYGTSQTTTDPPRVTICDPSATVPSCPSNTISSAQAALQAANPNTVSNVVQNNMMTNIDFTDRRRNESTDSRFVIHDTDMTYFGGVSVPQTARNRLTSAYFEQANRDAGTMYRIGRQYASGGGLAGRFDGVSGSYNLSPKWRLNGAFGNIDETYSPYKKTQYGLSLDMQAPAEHWGGSAYLVEQRFDGLVDRRAVGLDARYFDVHKNFYANVDYDIDFKILNSAMFQANWQPAGTANYWANIDHRRSPQMLLSSAVDATQLSIAQLTSGIAGSTGAPLTLAEIRQDLARLTPVSNTLAIGMTYPYSQKWQVGGDFHISNLSGTSATEYLPTNIGGVLTFRPDSANAFRPATSASGVTLGYTAQLIGNNQIWANDILVISGSYFDATRSVTGAYTGESLSINHVAVPNDKWRFDTALRLYFQSTRDTGQKISRISPSFKLSYRVRENVNLESEINIDRSSQKGGVDAAGNSIPDSHDLTKFYYFGYRWDWL